MLESLVKALLLISAFFGAEAVVRPTFGNSLVDADCRQLDKSDKVDINTLLCRGSRAIRNILQNLSKTNRPIVIVRGLEIVPTKDAKAQPNSSVLQGDFDGSSVLERFSDYLHTHELNIKFSDLLAEESERYAARDSERNSVNVQEPRKKDKGQGTLLVAAMMFAKVLVVMGLGGIGALAIKALGVAMTALMMTGVVGLKSLSQQGHESSSVQYVTADGGGHHHSRRRRRSAAKKLSLPFNGWHEMAVKENTGHV